MGYPSGEDEVEILSRRLERRQDDVALAPIVGADEFRAMQASLEDVHVEPSIRAYAVSIVSATREDGQLEVGASPRGSLALVKLGRAVAALRGRDFVTPDDVRSVAVAALAHRVVLRPEVWVRQVSPDEVVRGIVDQVPAPSWT